MSAPQRPISSQAAGHVAFKAGAAAHRYGGVVGGDPAALLAVGVRCDDEDPRIGESALLRLRPGKTELVARLPYSVAAAGGDLEAPLLLDHDGALRRVDGAVVLAGVHAIVGHAARRDADLTDVRDGRVILTGVYAVGQDGDGYVAVTADRLVSFTTGLVERGAVRVTSARASALPAAIATCGLGSTLGVIVHGQAGKRELLVVDRTTGLATAFAASPDARCVARAPSRFLVGGASGLFAKEDDDDRLRAFRPSLRAHQLLWTGAGRDTLVVVADLFVALSDDGTELVTRDLSGFLRLAAG